MSGFPSSPIYSVKHWRSIALWHLSFFLQHEIKWHFWFAVHTVSVLWRYKGYTVKYSLSVREIPRAEPKGFPEGSVYNSPYIPPLVIIQTFSISKSYTSSMSFLIGRYWKSCFSVLVWQLVYIFPYCPVGKAIRVRMDQVENSVVAALGNTHGQDSNTKRVKFQYYPF